MFQGFREGEFWSFKCSYKFKIGEVDKYRFVKLGKLASHTIHANYPFLLTPVAREHPPGLIELCIRPTPTHPILQKTVPSPISCILQSRHIPPQIMYVPILGLSFPMKMTELLRNPPWRSSSFHPRPPSHCRVTMFPCFPYP